MVEHLHFLTALQKLGDRFVQPIVRFEMKCGALKVLEVVLVWPKLK